jgi:hypothetical protein
MRHMPSEPCEPDQRLRRGTCAVRAARLAFLTNAGLACRSVRVGNCSPYLRTIAAAGCSRIPTPPLSSTKAHSAAMRLTTSFCGQYRRYRGLRHTRLMPTKGYPGDQQEQRPESSIAVELFPPNGPPDWVLYKTNDYRPSHRRDRGAGRGTCESYDAFGASRWPRPDRQRACLRGSDHASDREHASRQADRGGLDVPNPGWAASVFPACITESRRDARWHRRRCARKQTAIPPSVASSPGA